MAVLNASGLSCVNPACAKNFDLSFLDAVIEINGLRNPCAQLNGIQSGLMAAVLDKDAQGKLVRKAGVMAIVIVGGEVKPSDPIHVELPPKPHQMLDRI